jgi:hypothetical protein
MEPRCYYNEGHLNVLDNETPKRVSKYMDEKYKYQEGNSLGMALGLPGKSVSKRLLHGVAKTIADLAGDDRRIRLDPFGKRSPRGGLYLRGTRQQIYDLLNDAGIGVQFGFDARMPVWIGAHDLGKNSSASLASMLTGSTHTAIVMICQAEADRVNTQGLAFLKEFYCHDASRTEPLNVLLHNGGEGVTVSANQLILPVSQALDRVKVY